MFEDLAGKVAVVTGGARGLGLQMATALAGQAADVALLDVLPASADSAAALSERTGLHTTSATCDVTNPTSVAAAFAHVQETLGVPAVLVNAAGITIWADSVDTTATEWRRVIDVNLTGTFLSCQSFARAATAAGSGGSIINVSSMSAFVVSVPVYLPGDLIDSDPAAAATLIATNVTGVIGTVQAAIASMVPRGSGDIVVTSSVSGHQAIHWEPVYSASKHAVQALVHGVRRQLVGSGVRIGAIAPGVVLNDLWQVVDEDERSAAVAAGTGIRSEDVAEAVEFMLTRPRHVQIRDLVILPVNQEI